MVTSSETQGQSATILDKINGKPRPPLPPKSRMGKWRVFALRAPSSLIWGGWGFAVPFYFVQDCSNLGMSTRKVILYNLDIGKCDVSGWPVRAIVSYGTKTIRFLEDGEKTFSRRIYCKTKRDTC